MNTSSFDMSNPAIAKPPPTPPPGKRPTPPKGPRPPSDTPMAYKKDGGIYHYHEDVYYHEEEDPGHPKKGLYHKFKKAVNKRFHAENAHTRLIVCALAVSLLWASSLLVCRLVVYSFIPRPLLDDVFDRATTMSEQVQSQKSSYTSDVNAETFICREAYETTNQIELDRVNALLVLNNESIDFAQEIVGRCTANFATLIETVITLNNDSTISFSDNAYFSADAACTAIQAEFDRELAARLAYDAVVAHDAEAEDSVSTLQDRLDARARYDAEYLANLTGLSGVEFPGGLIGDWETSFDDLGICMTGEGDCTGNLFESVSGMYDDMEEEYNNIKTRAQGYADEAQEYVDDVKDVVAAVGSAAAAIGALQTDFSGFACCNLNALPWTADLSLTGMTAGINADLGFPDTTEIQEAIGEQVDAFGEKVEEEVDKIKGLDTGLGDLQADFFATISTDYDPPPVDDVLNITVDGVAEDFAQSLGIVSGANVSEERDLFFNNANESAAQFLQAFDPREWELFAYGSDVFAQFQLGTDLFTNYALLFDAVYRILYSLLLIRKYWNISGIVTPPADVRNDSYGVYKEKKNIVQKLGYLLTHPLVNMFVIAVWVFVIAYVMWAAYEPIYTQYTQGCVENGPAEIASGEVEGTMIYRNLLTVSENFAFSEGDQAVAEGIDTLNLEREFACRVDFDASLDERTQQNETYNEIVRQQTESIDKYDLLNFCVDWAAIDGVTASAFGLDDLATEPDCALVFPPINLSDAILHNCAAIEPCIYTFDDSPVEQVRSVSHATSCEGEFYLHAYLLSWVFAIAMYILLNLARIYFMRGVIAVWWRRITVNRFSYLASCTPEGYPIDPKDVEEKGEKWENVVSDKLKIVLAKFERYGYFEIAYAVGLQLPWIIGLSVLGQNLKFEA